ncbi:MAG TPA: KpsF/GutQ family sugar-phosphate isomerase [Kiritimatiellia bacterium]|nr:KpsF/GutQ family sugar-phosphate isomerase [Kiritimatiellia bacterium]
MNHAQRAKDILSIEIEGLTQVRDNLGKEFARVVERLLASIREGHKIVVTGVGKNQPIGQKIAATLTSTGSPAVFLHASDAMHGDLGLVSPGDPVLALSYSGESEELLHLIPLIKRKEAPIIAITGNRESSLAKLSDDLLLVNIPREACPFNLAPTTSTTVTLAVGDALAMVLLEARGFRREDYAKLHPSGAIGRTLLLKISDIMRRGERCARILAHQTVQHAIIAMTEARSGAVAVVDDHQTVLGIFTDGDLRRHLADTPDLLHAPISHVMTPKPITLHEDLLAVDALAIYQKRNVDDLIVVDREGRLAGMVDIQDLPKFKIL